MGHDWQESSEILGLADVCVIFNKAVRKPQPLPNPNRHENPVVLNRIRLKRFLGVNL
jgi:hypothetical protein